MKDRSLREMQRVASVAAQLDQFNKKTPVKLLEFVVQELDDLGCLLTAQRVREAQEYFREGETGYAVSRLVSARELLDIEAPTVFAPSRSN